MINTRKFLHLENDRFHDLTDAALLYIARDAKEAANAMRGHDPVAECKYLDQVNDACSVMAARRRAVS